MAAMLQCTERWSWCLRRVMKFNKGRALATNADDVAYRGPEEGLKEAQDFLDNLTGSMKKKLQLLETDYRIRLENNEQVPPELTSSQKKYILLYVSKEKWPTQLQKLWNNRIRCTYKTAIKKEKDEELQLFVDMKEDTFIYANERKFFYTYYKNRMAQTFLTGMPIVLDAGYKMTVEETGPFLTSLVHTHKAAKAHKQPANIIVSGLDKNPVLKQMIEARSDLTRMMVGYRNQPFWTLFPDMPIVYLSNRGPELEEFDGNKLYVLSTRSTSPYYMEKIPKTCYMEKIPIQRRIMPYQSSVFAHSRGLMLDFKANILMDLSLERDIDKAFLDSIKSGEFDNYFGIRKLSEFTQTYMDRTQRRSRN